MAQYSCEHCKQCFQRKGNIVSHMKVKHKDEVLKFICPLFPLCKTSKCDGYFYPIGNLKVHFKKAHAGILFCDHEKDVKCALINKNSEKIFLIFLEKYI